MQVLCPRFPPPSMPSRQGGGIGNYLSRIANHLRGACRDCKSHKFCDQRGTSRRNGDGSQSTFGSCPDDPAISVQILRSRSSGEIALPPSPLSPPDRIHPVGRGTTSRDYRVVEEVHPCLRLSRGRCRPGELLPPTPGLPEIVYRPRRGSLLREPAGTYRVSRNSII